MTKPPALRGKMKYSAIADLSESSQDDIPRKTTSLSMSSLLRADANFPLQFFASLPTTAGPRQGRLRLASEEQCERSQLRCPLSKRRPSTRLKPGSQIDSV